MSKLLEFQKRVNAIAKDSKNPFFKSNYFDINKLLEEIKPILTDLKLIINQPLSNINGLPALKTILQSVDGDKLTTIFDETIPLIVNTDPQKFGATITYFRRYALVSMFALQAEDDDGNMASGKYEKSTSVKEVAMDKLKAVLVGKDDGEKLRNLNATLGLNYPALNFTAGACESIIRQLEDKNLEKQISNPW